MKMAVSGMLHGVVWQILTDVSEEFTTSSIRVITAPDDESKKAPLKRLYGAASRKTAIFTLSVRT
jgi:hypothetical protein